MKQQRYLIAKYVADLRRNEPQNIGVILWVRGKTEARFLDEHQARFVNDPATYRRWVDYWNKLIQKDSFLPKRGSAVHRNDEAFVDAVISTQKDNYMLVDGGAVLDSVTSRDISSAIKYLFDELVSVKNMQIDHTDKEPLSVTSETLFQESGIARRNDFTPHYDVKYHGNPNVKPLTFHYAIANGVPEALFQRASIDKVQSIQSTAFMFDSQKEVGIRRCGALIRATEHDLEKPDTASLIDILKERATVINLADFENAVKQVKDMTKKVVTHHNSPPSGLRRSGPPLPTTKRMIDVS